MSPEERLEAMLTLEQEAKRTATDALDQLEAIRKANAVVSPERAKAFMAARHARFWQMPRWLWMPIVAILVTALLLAFVAPT